MGSTTYEEFRKFFEKDQALTRRFQKIDINEPS
jgi:ATP-dependent Clp protease ATP-binding subunit ClpA